MASGEKCVLCGYSELEDLFEEKDRLRPLDKESFSVAKCRSCGLVCTLPYVGPEEVKRYYPDEYYSSGGAEMSPACGAFQLWFSRIYSRLLWRAVTGKERPFFPMFTDQCIRILSAPLYRMREKCFPYRENPGKFLDIGCGTGRLLAEERALGWETYGVEPGERASAYARETCKLDIFVGELKDAGFPEASFDVISLRHVLEHFLDPVTELRVICGKLKPGGVMVLKVPNLSFIERAVFGRRWWAYELPRHRFHFTRATIVKTIEKAGFKKTKAACLLNVNNMILSTRNYLEDMGVPPRVLLFFNVDNKFARAFFLPLAFLLKLAGDSGEILVYAVKED